MTKYLKIKEINFNNQKYNYNTFNEPIVFRNNCKNNLAFKEWNINTLPNIFEKQKLPVEVYLNDKNYKSAKKENIEKYYSMKKIIKYYNSNKRPYIYCAEIDLNEYTHLDLDRYFTNFNVTNRYSYTNLLFFGNNARSNCHLHVNNDYLLNQIFGKKTVYLFNYFDNNVKMNNITSDKSNFIKDDFFKMDHDKMKIYKVNLNAGDSLSIPPWWYHATIGSDINCSLTIVYPRNNLLYLLNKPSLVLSFIFYNYDDLLMYIAYLIVLYIIIKLFFKYYK